MVTQMAMPPFQTPSFQCEAMLYKAISPLFFHFFLKFLSPSILIMKLQITLLLVSAFLLADLDQVFGSPNARTGRDISMSSTLRLKKVIYHKTKKTQYFLSVAYDITFLDASSHLYKRVCPSIRPSVHPPLGSSVSL